MSSISTVTQINQQTKISSNASNLKDEVSLFNINGATTSVAPQVDSSTNQSRDDKTNKEPFDKFIDDMLTNMADIKISKDELIEILAQIGYTKESVKMLNSEIQSEKKQKIANILNYIYNNDDEVCNRKNQILKLAKYNSGNIDEINDYVEKFINYSISNLKKIMQKGENPYESLSAQLKGENIYEPFIEQLKDKNQMSQLSTEDFCNLLGWALEYSEFLETQGLNKHDMLLYIIMQMPESVIKENEKIRELVMDIIQEECDNNKLETSTIFIAVMDKVKDSKECIEEVLNNGLVDDIFKTLQNAESATKFFVAAQAIIDSGSVEQKTILANKISEFVQQNLDKKLLIESKDANKRTLEENQFLELYEKTKGIYISAAAYAEVRADEEHAQNLHDSVLKDAGLTQNVYQGIYNYGLLDKNVNPVDITKKIDKISNNKYSATLIQLGYELPAFENIDRLKAQAEQGVFQKQIQNSLSETSRISETTDIGYTQSSKAVVENAASNTETILENIIASTQSIEQQFVIEKSQTQKQKPKLNTLNVINTANLSGYTANDLSEMITNGVVKFGDAIKQYSTHLSESGKQFVVKSIKMMDKGNQIYTLNSINNTAKWEIMKKADLLDDDLNVEFDFDHEKLREKNQA